MKNIFYLYENKETEMDDKIHTSVVVAKMDDLRTICVDKVGKNLNFLIDIYCKNSVLNLPFGIVDEIFNSYLIHSGIDGLDDRILNSILMESLIRNLIIYPEKFKNVKYYDFLNDKKLDNLKAFFYGNNMNIEKNENFSLEINNFELIGLRNIVDELPNNHLLMNCKVLNTFSFKFNTLEDSFFHLNFIEDYRRINIIHSILNNASDNLENLYIDNVRFSEEYLNKFVESVKRKINLKDVYLNFLISDYDNHTVNEDDDVGDILDYSEEITKYIRDMLLPSSKTISSIEFGNIIYSKWNFAIGNELFESLNNLKSIKFKFFNISNEKSNEDIYKFFEIVHKQNENSLKNIHFTFDDFEIFQPILYEFINRFRFLEKVEIISSCLNYKGFPQVVNSLIPSIKTMKVLNLHNLSILTEMESKLITNFMAFSKLTEIYMRSFKFNIEPFTKFLLAILHSKCKLKVFSIQVCRLDQRHAHLMGQFLAKVNTLEKFSLVDKFICQEFFQYLCNGLKSSSECLKDIQIHMYSTYLFDGYELIDLINNLKNFQAVEMLYFLNYEKCFNDLSNSLMKFQRNFRKLVIRFIMKDEHFKKLFKFLIGCYKLECLKITTDCLKEKFIDELIQSLENCKNSIQNLYLNFDFQCYPTKLFQYLNDCPNLQFVSLKMNEHINKSYLDSSNFHFTILKS